MAVCLEQIYSDEHTGKRLLNRERKREYVILRTVFAKIALDHGVMGLDIASFLGVDHSTVNYYMNQANDQIDVKDVPFMSVYQNALDSIQKANISN